MKHIILFLIALFFIPIQLIADRVELRVSYSCGEREAVGEIYQSGIEMTLDIGDSVSRFYYRDTIDHAKYPSSDPRGRKPVSYTVYKNYPSEGLLVYSENFIPSGKCFRYEEEMPKWEWELQEGDSTILGYPCKKAVTTFRGRKWIAWYAVDLPYDNGPWKLGGLPGLILFAHDANKDFPFHARIIKKGDGTPIEVEKKEFFKITPKRMQELKALKITDFNTFMYETTGRRIISYPNYIPPKRTPCLIEIFE